VKGRDGKLDGMESWTGWKVGRDGKLDGMESWTGWKVGRDGKLDGIELSSRLVALFSGERWKYESGRVVWLQKEKGLKD
jgi:hypothetical protein